MKMSMSYIVIIGNPVDGLEFRGTFSNPDDATEWAELHSLEEWCIAPLGLATAVS